MGKKSNILEICGWLSCVGISLAIIIAIVITSCEIAIYADMDYYQVLYEKYNVAEDLEMEMEDILYVTQEMMLFLRGDREDLIIETVVDGIEREFFNETEISHMVDVQGLFVGGLRIRNLSFMIAVILFILSIIKKVDCRRILPKAFQYTSLGFTVIMGGLGYLFATNFYKYFTKFHEIFFEDGTWTFDPNESLMINMLPEGLFYDFTLRIVVVFFILMGIFLSATVLSAVLRRRSLK